MSTFTVKDMEEAAQKMKEFSHFDTIIGHPSVLNPIGDIPGISIVGNPTLTKTKQTKFPCSKKKRIRKKFAKKYTKQVPSDEVYLLNTDIFNRWNPRWEI